PREARRRGVAIRPPPGATMAGVPLRKRFVEHTLETLDPFASLRPERLDLAVGEAGRRFEEIACEVERRARRFEQPRAEFAAAIAQQRLGFLRPGRALVYRLDQS